MEMEKEKEKTSAENRQRRSTPTFLAATSASGVAPPPTAPAVITAQSESMRSRKVYAAW